MRILIYSPLFYPSIGGLETVISILAHGFVAQGHEIRLISRTPDPNDKSFPFEVIRQPTSKELIQLARWCDIYFQGCVSLKGILPAIITCKPLVVTHQTWYLRPSGKASWQDYLKQFVTQFSINIAASHAVDHYVWGQSVVIPNPYRDDLFQQNPDIERDRELVFLGRLVSDKGADLLLQTLANLKSKGLTPRLTLIGKGPEESALKQLAVDLEIASQVDFVGAKVGEDLVSLLNAHQIMIVPSRWQEPFGIVALEGIACGCVVVGSDGGGLKDAIGPCGVTFPNEDVASLAQVIAQLLSYPDQLQPYRREAKAHLSLHHPAIVAQAYLKVFETALR
jgi:glycosyltransferase involved in cell wall biosynthesis